MTFKEIILDRIDEFSEETLRRCVDRMYHGLGFHCLRLDAEDEIRKVDFKEKICDILCLRLDAEDEIRKGLEAKKFYSLWLMSLQDISMPGYFVEIVEGILATYVEIPGEYCKTPGKKHQKYDSRNKAYADRRKQLAEKLKESKEKLQYEDLETYVMIYLSQVYVWMQKDSKPDADKDRYHLGETTYCLDILDMRSIDRIYERIGRYYEFKNGKIPKFGKQNRKERELNQPERRMVWAISSVVLFNYLQHAGKSLIEEDE